MGNDNLFHLSVYNFFKQNCGASTKAAADDTGNGDFVWLGTVKSLHFITVPWACCTQSN